MSDLADALALWRETRSAAIADAIDGLSDAALAGWQPPAPRTNQAFHDAWLAATADHARRGWAVRTLLDKLPGTSSDDKADSLLARLDQLAETGPDPRVARELARQLELAPPILGFTEVADRCAALLADMVDERLCAQLAAMRDTADEDLDERIETILRAAPTVRTTTAAELARFAAHRPAPPPKAADTAALFREVYAHPDSDDARIVLADVLQAQGDPRGELIALQLSGEGVDRAEELLAKHGKDWLGDLRKVTYRARFQRGFLTRLELDGTWRAPGGWAKVAADPSLGTVEDLIVGRATSEVYKQLATSPAMVGLKRIDVWDKHSLAALEQTPAKLSHVGCSSFKRGNLEQVFAKQLLPACERIPTITSLGFAIEVFDLVKKSPLFERLERFVIGDFEELVAIHRRLPADATVEIWRWARLEECLAQRVQWLGAARIAKEDGKLVARVWGEWLISDLINAMSDLPKLARVVVQGSTGEQETALRAAAKRKKLAIDFEDAPRRIGYVTGIAK